MPKKNIQLITAIIRAGLSQAEAANKLGVSASKLSMVVNRRDRFTDEQADALASLLGVSRNRLGSIS